MTSPTLLRPLGQTNILVSPVALGCWPISGMTSHGVSDADSIATIHACFDLGVNFFDTAYCYGLDGESERLIARAIHGRRDQVVIATKSGIHWGEKRERVIDGRPEVLKRECETSLQRLGTDRVELLYLHAPDPSTPLADSAGALRELLEAGKARSIGASNFTLAQLQEFHAICPLAAFQPPYNMLQRQIERDTLPWCLENHISIAPYWPLLKGLLAGRLPRNYAFPPGDGRPKYPMFQGEEWQKNQDFVDELRAIARDTGRTVAAIAINWTIHQPGITSALCGAKRPDQILETAAGMGWKLSDTDTQRIEAALQRRGVPIVTTAV